MEGLRSVLGLWSAASDPYMKRLRQYDDATTLRHCLVEPSAYQPPFSYRELNVTPTADQMANSSIVTFNMQFFFGTFLSDLSNHQPSLDWLNRRAWIRHFVPPVFMFIGLWLASFPEANVTWTGWSTDLHELGVYLCRFGQDHPRFFTGIGMDFICLAIFLSPQLKDALSSKYLLWLGKHSFAVYLLHGTLIRSVLAWVMFGFWAPPAHPEEREGKIEMISGPRLKSLEKWNLIWVVPPFFCLLYTCAYYWTNIVDPYCAKITYKFEKWAFEQREKSTQGGLLQQSVGGQ